MEQTKEIKQRNRLSEKQIVFLDEFALSFNFKEAAKKAGYHPSQIRQFMQKQPESLFNRTYRKIQASVIDDPRFNKCGSVERMFRWMEDAEANGDLKLALEIQKELNKMIDGNMAVQKQITENKKEVNVNVIDLTKPKAGITQESVEDTNYEEVDDEE